MSATEGQEPGGTDPIDMQLPRGANWQWSRAVDTTIDSTSNTFDRHEEFVASGSKSLRQGKFLGWKWSFLTAVRAISKPLDEGLKKFEDNMNQDFRKSRLSAGDLELSGQAYTLLALLCKNEACAYVRSAEDGNGHQAWQALLTARTARSATNILNQLLEPTFTSPDPRINLRQWNKNTEEYATRTSEPVSDCIRRAVYMNKFAPQDMRQHLMLNQSRLSTAEEFAQEIEDYWDATEEFSRDDKSQAGFIGPGGKGSAKGGKLVECPTTLERVVARRAKEKCTKDSDFNPNVVNSESLVDTVIGVGKSAIKKPSVALNKST